jgi:hypothetical protein
MGFNHCYLTNVEDLQRYLDNVGLEKFIKTYRSYDALTGPSECFEFLENKIKENEKVISNNDIDGILQKGIDNNASEQSNYTNK